MREHYRGPLCPDLLALWPDSFRPSVKGYFDKTLPALVAVLQLSPSQSVDEVSLGDSPLEMDASWEVGLFLVFKNCRAQFNIRRDEG